MDRLTLISFATCPYVQRAVIALKEKGVAHQVIYVDLAKKPDWFLAISPLGKVPVLKVERDGQPPVHIFESAVILEYLEETAAGPKLHPADPLERARHRSYIEFASQTLADNWKLTTAISAADLEPARAALAAKLQRLESTIVGPLFSGKASAMSMRPLHRPSASSTCSNERSAKTCSLAFPRSMPGARRSPRARAFARRFPQTSRSSSSRGCAAMAPRSCVRWRDALLARCDQGYLVLAATPLES